jgi:heat shock protein HslJ
MRILLIVLIFVLFSSGCAGEVSSTPTEEPVNPLAGTVWKLAAIQNQPVLEQNPFYLWITVDKIRGEMGCNLYQAGYAVQGQEIRLEQLSVTVQLCHPQELMEQEEKYIEAWNTYVLKQSARFEVRAGEYLEIFGPAGESVLLFENAVE